MESVPITLLYLCRILNHTSHSKIMPSIKFLTFWIYKTRKNIACTFRQSTGRFLDPHRILVRLGKISELGSIQSPPTTFWKRWLRDRAFTMFQEVTVDAYIGLSRLSSSSFPLQWFDHGGWSMELSPEVLPYFMCLLRCSHSSKFLEGILLFSRMINCS